MAEQDQRAGEDVLVVFHHHDVRLVRPRRFEQVRPGAWRLLDAVAAIGDAQRAPQVRHGVTAAAVAPAPGHMTQRRQAGLLDRLQQFARAEARRADQLGEGDVDLVVGFGEDLVTLVAAVEEDLLDLDPGLGLPALDHRLAEVFLPGQQRQALCRVQRGGGKQQADGHQHCAAYAPGDPGFLLFGMGILPLAEVEPAGVPAWLQCWHFNGARHMTAMPFVDRRLRPDRRRFCVVCRSGRRTSHS